MERASDPLMQCERCRHRRKPVSAEAAIVPEGGEPIGATLLNLSSAGALAMPMQYDTLVGDMGTVLSGGQKQRVLLARALYKKPSILVLDEATSALDVEREAEVNQAIRDMKITRIIIAHRPETIRSADRAILLVGGEVLDPDALELFDAETEFEVPAAP